MPGGTAEPHVSPELPGEYKKQEQDSPLKYSEGAFWLVVWENSLRELLDSEGRALNLVSSLRPGHLGSLVTDALSWLGRIS